jgi:hypothetical protein
MNIAIPNMPVPKDAPYQDNRSLSIAPKFHICPIHCDEETADEIVGTVYVT